MVAGRSIIVVSRELSTVRAVSAALDAPGRLAEENVCPELGALSGRLAQGPTDAVLVDLDGQPAKMLSALDPIVRKYPETRFIVVSNLMDPRLMLEAMQAGARHFMTKQELSSNLASVLRRLCSVGYESSGKVATILSASGGCGATTIAVNLAWELQATTERPSLLIDLDYMYGGVAAYLGAEGNYGMRDLQERSGPIDPELISTTTVACADQLKVLLSASSSNLGKGGGYQRLADTLQACRNTSPNVVIDAPRVPLENAAELARSSVATLLVMQLTVKDVRIARAMIDSLRQGGMPAESLIVLVNRYRKRGAILELEDVQRALGGVTISCLSNDFQAAAECFNFGKPLGVAASRSPLRREIQQLASRVATATSQQGSLA